MANRLFCHSTEMPGRRLLMMLRVLNVLAFLVGMAGAIRYGADVDTVSDLYRTPFTTNSVMSAIYWAVIVVHQIGFVLLHFSGEENVLATVARGVGFHFVLFELLLFAWLALFAHQHFFWSEAFLCLNFLNILALYFRLPPAESLKTFLFVHLGIVRLPLAALALGIFSNGAIMVHCLSTACRVLANVFVWEQLVLGGLLLLAFKDWATGLAIAYQTLSLAIAQLFIKVIGLQWIFAFIISGLLFLLSLIVLAPTGNRITALNQTGVSEDADERAQLLHS